MIKETLNATNKDIDCPICTRRFKHNDRAEVLACHANHILHEKCYADFVQSWNEKGWRLICPICRTPIQRLQVVKRLIVLDGSDQVPESDDKEVEEEKEEEVKQI